MGCSREEHGKEARQGLDGWGGVEKGTMPGKSWMDGVDSCFKDGVLVSAEVVKRRA